MTLSESLSAFPSPAAWLAVPFGATPLGIGEGVLGAAVVDVSAVAITSGVLIGLLALLAGLLRGGRQPVRAPARPRNAGRVRR
jgi:hypothetical protein